MDIENRSKSLAAGFVKAAGVLSGLTRLNKAISSPIVDSNLFNLLANKTISGLGDNLNVTSGLKYLGEMVSSSENRARLFDAMKSVAPSAKATAVGAGMGAILPAMAKLHGDMHAGKVNRNNIKQYFKDNIGTYGKNSLIGGAVGAGLGAGLSHADRALGSYNSNILQKFRDMKDSAIFKLVPNLSSGLREVELLPAIKRVRRSGYTTIPKFKLNAADEPGTKEILDSIDYFNTHLRDAVRQRTDFINRTLSGHDSLRFSNPSIYNIWGNLRNGDSYPWLYLKS